LIDISKTTHPSGCVVSMAKKSFLNIMNTMPLADFGKFMIRRQIGRLMMDFRYLNISRHIQRMRNAMVLTLKKDWYSVIN